MNIECITVGPIEVNCYIVWNEARHSLVIDPGDNAGTILDFLERRQLGVAAYAVTHGHVDHISALAAVSKKRPAPIGMHQADADWAFSAANEMQPIYNVPERPAKIARFLEDGQTWNDTGSTYEIIATPGHSPGGVCLYFPEENALFCGDTLFRGSVGRTDLPGGDGRILAQSLQKLACLPGKTRVYPGHGPNTTLEVEVRTNPFLINS